jgi:phosphate transport system permease protein
MESVEFRQDVAISRKSLVRASESLNLERRVRPTEEIVRAVLLFCGIVSIFTTIGIVYVLGRESSQFFTSRAFILAKAPVAAETTSIALAEAIPANSTIIPFTLDADRLPLADNQFIKINDEVMRVLSRGQRTLTVERALDGTTAADHATASQIFPMQEVQIKPLEPLSLEGTAIQVAPTFGREFTVGDTIQLDLEVMRVTGVEGDTLIVERGVDGTQAASHGTERTLQIADPVTIGEFLTSTVWQPQIGDFGILPLVSATLITSVIALSVAIPVGLASAIYLSEYAPRGVRNTLKPILEILAGIPTVVYGFFALTFMTPTLQSIFGNDRVEYYNMLSAGLVMGILIVPLISSMSEDALNAVPRALREASYGLGATRLETTLKVVLPAAISGVLSAFIIGASRAVGETMIVALAAGAGPAFTLNVFSGAETMTGHIARISGGDLGRGTIDYNSIFAIGLMLFLMTLVLNVISAYVVRRLREKY